MNLVHDLFSIQVRHCFFNPSFSLLQIQLDLLNGYGQRFLQFLKYSINILVQKPQRVLKFLLVNQCAIILYSFLSRRWGFVKGEGVEKVFFPVDRIHIRIHLLAIRDLLKSVLHFRV
jgi:hypothetical protein